MTKPGVNGLHLFVLFGFAVSQPLFYLLSRNAGFFAAHLSTPLEILMFILTLAIALPTVAWLFESLARLVAIPLCHGVHFLLVVFLVALVALPGLKEIPYLSGLLTVALAVFVGSVFALGYVRYQMIRSFVSVLAVAPLVFVGTFAFTNPIYKLLFRNELQREPPGKFDADDPVVMLIFDDLSLTSLMDEYRQIDPVPYPAFAALAKQSTWFRNTSTVHERTQMAVPAILTGRYPTHKSDLPTTGDYPLNLFTLLQGTYELNVHEFVTALYQPTQARSRLEKQSLLARVGSLYSDVWIIYAHVILPEELTNWLPPLEEKWKNFADETIWGAEDADSAGHEGRSEQFHNFLESITPCERSCLHFMHSLLPHPPWEYLPSGKIYYPSTVFGLESSYWGEEEWWVAQAYQRHLLQVQFADKLLGELVSRLKAIGMYDRSLIVVTADHGRSFWPKERHRNLNGAKHPEDILGVPLLIKKPYQRVGVLSDRNVETIDILPTIADLLGIQIPWPVDGCSALARDCPERNEKIAVTSRGKKIPFDAHLLRREDSLERKIELFGSAAKSNGLFMSGPYRRLVGRRIMEFGVGDAADVVISPVRVPEGTKDADWMPARIVAFFQSGGKVERTPYVAISVDDTIRTVVPALPDKEGKLVISAMLPEEAAKGEGDNFQFFMVKGSTEKPELYRISSK